MLLIEGNTLKYILESERSCDTLTFVIETKKLDSFNIKDINYIKFIIEKQVDKLGMHKTYNVLEHSKFINNINELKSAKNELKQALISNALLKDIEDNDPAGIKEIKLKLKEKIYARSTCLEI